METIAPLTYLLIAVLIIGRIAYRQLTWQPTGLPQFRLPLVLGALGVAFTAEAFTALGALSLLGWALICVEMATGIGCGLVMGMLARIRTGETGTESRGGLLGVALWIGLIAVRVGEQFVAHALIGDQLTQLTGLVLVMVAVTRLTAAVVFDQRVSNHRASRAVAMA